MRPLVILVADGTMKAVFQSFFRRAHVSSRLRCRDFEFDPAREIFDVPGATDGAVCLRCHELLRHFQRTHHRAIVVIDQQFGAERPAAEVREEMLARLTRSGWSRECVQVIVIDPELEIWLWQDNANVHQALGCQGTLRRELLESGEWPEGCVKPLAPKDTIQRLIRENRAGTTMGVYSRIAETVSANGCVDGSFLLLQKTLGAWFPMEGA